MQYIAVTELNRARINDFIIAHWFSTEMVVRGKVIDMTKVDGIYALDEASDKIIGLITYTIEDTVCEIMSFDSVEQGKGIGTTLLERLIDTVKLRGCRKIVLITTNDNIHAIRYYQRHGFDMAKLYHNALDVSRKLKPEIPLIGDDDIPLRHELEFELDLDTDERS